MSEPSDPLPILASDAERDGAVARLRQAVAEGRLTLEEFSDRVGAAHGARTDRDLDALTRDLPAAPVPAVPALPTEEHRAIFSHVARGGPWSLPQRSLWRSLFGTIELDLRQARLSGSDTELVVHNVFGTVTVIVPEGLEVIVRGGGLFASQRIDPQMQAALPGAPRLVIECRGPGGTLHVRSGRSARGLPDQLKAWLRRAITEADSDPGSGSGSGRPA